VTFVQQTRIQESILQNRTHCVKGWGGEKVIGGTRFGREKSAALIVLLKRSRSEQKNPDKCRGGEGG